MSSFSEIDDETFHVGRGAHSDVCWRCLFKFVECNQITPRNGLLQISSDKKYWSIFQHNNSRLSDDTICEIYIG